VTDDTERFPDDVAWDAWLSDAAGAIPGPDERDVQAARAKLMARLAIAESLSSGVMRGATDAPSETQRGMTRRDSVSRSWRMAIASVAVGCLLVGGGLFVRHIAPTRAIHTHAGKTYTTIDGQRATVTLADGSRVTLAPHTVLHVGEAFGHETRVVELTGEAYFDVPATSRLPFVVRSGAITTRVLGTAFDVRHYADDRDVRVAVVSGKVAVSRHAHGSPVTVTAGMIAFATDSSTTTTSVDRMDHYTGWTDGKLVFEQTPVTTMLVTVGHWYGYEFRLADSALARQHVSGEIDGSSSRTMLKTLEQMLDVRMTFDGNVITLYRRQNTRTGAISRRAVHDSFSLHTEAGR